MNSPLWLSNSLLPATGGSSRLRDGSSAFEKHQMTNNQFTAWDYVVLVVFLAASLAVGLVASCIGKGKKGKDKGDQDTPESGNDKEEFVMGNRQLQLIPVALSLLVSFNSAILILGGPAEIYFNGTMYVLSIFAENIGVVLAAVIFVPVFYNLRLTSSFEYLELRFKSRAVRLIGNFLLLINNVIYMGIALFAPATALQYVSQNSIPVEVSISVSGLICTFYTAWGGIKAVIWTDVFQSIVMTAGILAIIIKGLYDLSGIGNVWRIAEKYGRIEFDNFSFDPRVRHTFWGLVIGNGIAYSSTFGVFQASVQRYCSVPTLRKAQLSVILASIGAGFFVVASCLAGLVIFAHYASVGCDPSAAKWIENSNQIVPFYVMENLAVPVVPGLFIASLFAGALSSVSSSLSALAATTWEDFLKPYCCVKASDVKATWINRLLIVLYGVSAVIMGLVSTRFGGTVLQASLAFTGSFGAPLLGLFSMGVLFPFVNKYGAITGAVCGLVVSGWLSIGSYLNGKQLVGLPTNTSNCAVATPDPTASTQFSTTFMSVSTTSAAATFPPAPNPLDDWYSISYVWFPVIGAAATSACGFIVSLITRGYKEKVPDSLINPHAVRLYRFLSRLCGSGTGAVSPSMDDTEDARVSGSGAFQLERTVEGGKTASSQSAGELEFPAKPADQSDEGAIAETQPADQPGEGAIAEAQPADQPGEGAITEAQPAYQPEEGAIAEAQPAYQPEEGAIAEAQPADQPREGAIAEAQPVDKSGEDGIAAAQPADQSGEDGIAAAQPAGQSGEDAGYLGNPEETATSVVQLPANF